MHNCLEVLNYIYQIIQYFSEFFFYTARSAGQKGCVNMLLLSYGGGWGRGDSYRTNQSEAGKLKLFCDWLTKQRPGLQ